jgi:hypothetical protein
MRRNAYRVVEETMFLMSCAWFGRASERKESTQFIHEPLTHPMRKYVESDAHAAVWAVDRDRAQRRTLQ